MDCQDRLLEENQARKAVSDAALSNEISTLNRTIESLRSHLDDEKLKHGALQLLHQKMCTDRCELEDKISGLSTRGARLEADLKHSLANSEGQSSVFSSKILSFFLTQKYKLFFFSLSLSHTHAHTYTLSLFISPSLSRTHFLFSSLSLSHFIFLRLFHAYFLLLIIDIWNHHLLGITF